MSGVNDLVNVVTSKLSVKTLFHKTITGAGKRGGKRGKRGKEREEDNIPCSFCNTHQKLHPCP
jgi:hypothetical protein